MSQRALLTLTRSRTAAPSIRTSRLQLESRERLILNLRWGDFEGSSEACPLTGYGQDDLLLAKTELAAVSSSEVMDAILAESAAFLGRSPPASAPGGGLWIPSDSVRNLVCSRSSPSVRFCLEALVLRAVSFRVGVPFWSILCSRPVATRLQTSFVIDPRAPGYREYARTLWNAGVRTFKVKCGVDAPSELHALDVLSRLGADVKLRVDANRSWDLDAAKAFMTSATSLPVEWFEDPLAEWSQWGALRNVAPAATLAMDECLVGGGPAGVDGGTVDVLVLKPMALGGLAVCLRWAERARQHGQRVCVSHLFDGTLALEATIALAFAIQSPEIATGLGPHSGLETGAAWEVKGLATSELVLVPATSAC